MGGTSRPVIGGLSRAGQIFQALDIKGKTRANGDEVSRAGLAGAARGSDIRGVERQAEKWKSEVELDELGESLCRLRLCDPEQQQAMERSLSKLGQLAPVLANCREGRLEVIDGFKRLRAARALGWTKLRAEQVDVHSAEAKMRMCQCNRSRGLSELEEAWVIRAMHRDDKLMQSEIAQMFGRHKSWVNRRLLLAEGLCDPLQADLRLGLMSASAGRELARLPRGNQEAVAEVVKRRGLTTKQVVALVEAWRQAPSEEQRATLLERAGVGAEMTTSRKRTKTAAEWIMSDVEEVRRRSARLQGRLMGAPLSRLGQETAQLVECELQSLRPVLTALVSTLGSSLGEPSEVEP